MTITDNLPFSRLLADVLSVRYPSPLAGFNCTSTSLLLHQFNCRVCHDIYRDALLIDIPFVLLLTLVRSFSARDRE